ncbi:Uncharacterized conserved protein YloU, alkaline shock protein (Asp23) family [Marininema mesophilum]|uniref:Uncharacterized conserved protein YloU, alkaline shock protein (Asp23) family n=1 Tax=Marininema mesophilum TaxID=1048340 RepID=A0A1H3BKU4_9BACL|nr:Asp23/Gls24 family envelope stress response protein [Marininema mesophilum]SDX42527.1 Uncharacterized conserved protein YloU, alkaline shock protein (Asp23) family [Marininema mesophilum]
MADSIHISNANHTITTKALETIATAATEGTKGVTGTVKGTSRVTMRRGQEPPRRGVVVSAQEDGSITVSIRLMIAYGEYIPKVGEETIKRVSDALHDMAGIRPDHVHIRVEGITVPE